MPTDELRAFGLLIKTRRKTARLSLERLAVLCGLSSSSIKHVEKGRVSLATCSALLATPELRLTVDDLPTFAREPHRQHKGDTALLRLGLSLTEFAAREEVLAGVMRFAAHRGLPELGEWAKAKLLTVHRLRSALYSTDELPAAGRACRSNRRDCAGFEAEADCRHTVG
jgi:transcriptional regulator with XRE-family HTH domain